MSLRVGAIMLITNTNIDAVVDARAKLDRKRNRLSKGIVHGLVSNKQTFR